MVQVTGGIALQTVSRLKAHLGRFWAVYLVAVACAAAYIVLSLARWNRMATPSWDLAIFEQAVRGWAYHGVPTVDIKGVGFNQLGDHFSPFLALLAPFYRLFPTPVTLLVAQCLLVAVSIIPIGAVARDMVGPRSGLAVTVGYGVSWGLQAGVDVQFHEYCLAVPILAFGLAAFLRGRWVPSVVWMAMLFGVKEDLGFTVVVFGLALAIKGRRRLGAGVAAGALLCTGLILTVIIPAFGKDGHWDYWGKLSSGGGAAGEGSGGSLLAAFFETASAGLGTKLATLVFVILISAGAGLFSPLGLLVIPTLAWRFLGSTTYYWGTTWHYSMILMPIMVAAALDGIRRLAAARREGVRFYARLVPLFMMCVGIASLGLCPLRDLISPLTYAPPARGPAALQVLDLIPDGASVATDIGLMTRLPGRTTVYWLDGSQDPPPDYVLVDAQAGWSDEIDDVAALAESMYGGADYVTIADIDGYKLAQRR